MTELKNAVSDTLHDAANDAMKRNLSTQPTPIDPTLHTAVQWVRECGVDPFDAAAWMARNAPELYDDNKAQLALASEL